MKAIFGYAAVLSFGIALASPSVLSKPRPTSYKGSVEIKKTEAATAIKGRVCLDRNRDSVCQKNEKGLGRVLVSDGLNVVKTNFKGEYELPLPTDADEARGMSIFVTQPDGYSVPVDEFNVPQFYYVHKPNGSPLGVEGEPFRFGGLAPTGALPNEINFPMIWTGHKRKFKIVVAGDTQAYSNTEIGYIRDTIASEWAAINDLQAVIVEGDVMGDDLSLYPRFKEILSVAKAPQYYVGGNHDLDFDAPSDDHSFDTFRREWGPEYYSFDIGQVHFVVLDDVKYPCLDEDNLDGLHGGCDDDILSGATYNGVITERQLEWLANDLAHVPAHKLIVVNKHIPIASFIDQNIARQMVDNQVDLYKTLGCEQDSDTGFFPPENCARRVLALSGHTHTLEQIRPGESFEGWETTLTSGGIYESGGPAPFPQIVTGAAAGSWWSGDFDSNVVPESWQRLGGPRGYLVIEFNGNQYRDTFKATGMAADKQMSIDFLTPSFEEWFRTLADWRNSGADVLAKPPVNINDLPDTKQITLDELAAGTYLSVNVWNGSKESVVSARFDLRKPISMTRTQAGEGENILETLDPFALKRQMQIARFAYTSESGEPRANGFELFGGSQRCPGGEGPCTPRPDSSFFWADQSQHIWQLALPTDLDLGVHVVKVKNRDRFGRTFEETVTFEIVEERSAKYFQSQLFN